MSDRLSWTLHATKDQFELVGNLLDCISYIQPIEHLRCSTLGIYSVRGCWGAYVACCMLHLSCDWVLENLSFFYNARVSLASISTNTLVILTVISMCLLSTLYAIEGGSSARRLRYCTEYQGRQD